MQQVLDLIQVVLHTLQMESKQARTVCKFEQKFNHIRLSCVPNFIICFVLTESTARFLIRKEMIQMSLILSFCLFWSCSLGKEERILFSRFDLMNQSYQGE